MTTGIVRETVHMAGVPERIGALLAFVMSGFEPQLLAWQANNLVDGILNSFSFANPGTCPGSLDFSGVYCIPCITLTFKSVPLPNIDSLRMIILCTINT